MSAHDDARRFDGLAERLADRMVRGDAEGVERAVALLRRRLPDCAEPLASEAEWLAQEWIRGAEADRRYELERDIEQG